jgi:Peptidase family M28
MRFYSFLLLQTFLFLAACSPAKYLIEAPNVDRLIKTLASDEMGGRQNFKPSIDKAAQFIADEFKSIGLQPFQGNADFLQKFSLYELRPENTSVSLNDQAISGADFFFMTNRPKLEISTGYNLEKIQKGEDFRARFQAIQERADKTKPTIVLVSPTQESVFRRYQSYYSAPKPSLNLDIPEPSLLFVLSDLENVQKAEAKISQEVVSKPMANVVGMIEGSSRKNEYVIYSAHYDHLGILDAVGGDSIANGANDDASGTAAVISLAKYFKQKNKNERTLIFVAFAAEEVGLYGSQYFSGNMKAEEVMAMVNIEMIGYVAKSGKNTAFVTGFDESDLGMILQKNLQGSEFQYVPDPYPALNLFLRSDNATLARQGVPAHTVSTYRDDDKQYHTVDDEYELIDVANMTQIIQSIAKSSESIVSGKDTPSRIKKK